MANREAEELIEQYRILHANGSGAFEGRSLLPNAWHVRELMLDHPTQTILDYGCGAGIQYSRYRLQDWLGVMPTLYDPAVPAFAAKPQGQFDGVICSDVMEHLPESALEEVVEEICDYARKWVFFSVCCRPAGRILPNGRNAHVTVQPPEFWKLVIKRRTKARGLACRIEWTT